MATAVLSLTPSLAIVTNLVAAHLTIRPEDIDPDRPLALYGLDSVSAMELLAATEDAIGRTLPACLFVDHPTLRTVAATIDGAVGATASRIVFEDEALLPDDICTPALPIIHPPKTVLLTGATGFLGAHVLRALADNTTATICCFVRADAGQGLARVRANLERYGLWRSGLTERLEMVRGDLGRPALGLGADEYDGLADTVDAIYHVAADVNWVHGYAALRDVNVGGTLSLIRLAAEARPKAFHFVSSLSVGYVPGDSSLVVDETTDVLPFASRLPLGYAQTKAVAESLLRQAGARGLPVHVTRPGLIAGDSTTGASNVDDLIARVIKGSIAMGRAPDLQWQFEAVPVDHVARAIVRAGATAPGFHVTHIAPDRPRTWQECVLWLNARGYACTLEPFESWRVRLAGDAATSVHPLHGLRPFFAPREMAERSAAELYQADAHARVNSDDSRASAAARSESWPSVDAPMLGRIVDDYVRRGWLPEAPGRVPPSPADHDRPTPAWREVAGVERMLQDHFDDPALHVTALAEISTGSAHSIVSELTSRRTGAPVGLFGLRARIARGTSESTLDVLIKAKPSDTEAIDVACHLARMCSGPLGEAVSAFREDLDLRHGHHREPGIYRDAGEALRPFLPRAYGTWCDDDARQWGVALERITNAPLMDAVEDTARWTPAHLATSIDGLAAMHAAGMTAIDRWRVKPWMRARRSARDMAAMTPLWSALADHAAVAFDWWSHDSVLARHRRLVTTIDQWWPAIDAIPETLAHNDCNPRNLVIRNVPGGTRLCAFDWELAALAAPQRDLAEWLCFVLPPDVDAATARALVDRHRDAMVRAGADVAHIGDAAWRQATRAALAHVLIDRLAFYALIQRVRPQLWLRRVVATWGRLEEVL
jgi:thioester reductase-like protein